MSVYEVLGKKDDGTAEHATDNAAGLIGLAYYRTVKEGGDPAAVMLSLSSHAKAFINKEQWKKHAGVSS